MSATPNPSRACRRGGDDFLAEPIEAHGDRCNGVSPPTPPDGKSEAPNCTIENLMVSLFETLTAQQKSAVCFPSDYKHPVLGLLSRRIENDWRITKPRIASDFYSPTQQSIIHSIFFGLIDPAWRDRFRFALREDAKEYGVAQSLAFFGVPGQSPTQIVFTCRHLTLRCNTDDDEPCAFGGPIFYGHEGPHKNALDPASNIFWYQAVSASRVYQSLTAAQQRQALVDGRLPRDGEIEFLDTPHASSGIAVANMHEPQRRLVERLVHDLSAPFRSADRQRVWKCLAAQGGLDACRLSFYERGQQLDNVWRCWRLQGPSLVWYFKGKPHIHVWVHVSRDRSVHVNAANSYDLLSWRYGTRKPHWRSLDASKRTDSPTVND